MINDVSWNFNINLRLYLNVLYQKKMSNQLKKKVNEICQVINNGDNKFHEETLLFLLQLLYEMKKEDKELEQKYYYILTYLLKWHDEKPMLDTYYLTPYCILNSKINNLKFEQRGRAGLFLNNFNNKDLVINESNIENFISVQDFIEINKCVKAFGFNIDKNFWFNCYIKNFKKWPDKVISLFYKIYFYFLQKNTKAINDIKKDIYNQKFENILWSESYNFIFIAFAVDLKQNPTFNNFWDLFNKLNGKVFKNTTYGYDIPPNLLWIAASYLDWNEYEKIVIKIYQGLNEETKNNYLNNAIKYYLRIFEHVNNQIFRYSFLDFNNILDKLNRQELEQSLEAKYPVFEGLIETRISMESLSSYNFINTSEEYFLNYNLNQKISYLTKYLNDHKITWAEFNELISVIRIDKDKDEIINSFKKDYKNSEFLPIVVAYFECEENKESLEKYFDKKHTELKKVDFDERLEFTKNIFDGGNLKIFFSFFYNLNSYYFSDFIKSLYKDNLLKSDSNLFKSFYENLKIIFNNHYKEFWKFLNQKISFFNSYKLVYFKVMSHFINPDELYTSLEINKLIDYKLEFMKNYFFNIELIMFNKWTFKTIYKKENELDLWVCFISFVYWKWNGNWRYVYWQCVEWFFKQGEINLEFQEKQEFFLKLTKSKNIFWNKKDVLNFGNTTIFQNWTGEEYCKINLFVSYVEEQAEYDSTWEYINKNLDFYLSNSLNFDIIMLMLDNYYFKNTTRAKKTKLIKLFNTIINYFTLDSDDLNSDLFTIDEFNNIRESKEFYNYIEKIIRFIIEFHLASLEEIKEEWSDEKKYNIKVLINANPEKRHILFLLKRYATVEQFQEKFNFIKNFN